MGAKWVEPDPAIEFPLQRRTTRIDVESLQEQLERQVRGVRALQGPQALEAQPDLLDQALG